MHLYELLVATQRREPVAPESLFPELSSRYQLTALAFARKVEAAGGRTFNVESRWTAALDREYAELFEAALAADLAFFKRPRYATFLEAVPVEERFLRSRERLMRANIEHFAAAGFDVVARLGRLHSGVRRVGVRPGAPASVNVVKVEIGPGVFYPEQILKRRALFGLAVEEEDRLRGYLDRLLRILPAWNGTAVARPEEILELEGERLFRAVERCDSEIASTRWLPRADTVASLLRTEEGRASSSAIGCPRGSG